MMEGEQKKTRKGVFKWMFTRWDFWTIVVVLTIMGIRGTDHRFLLEQGYMDVILAGFVGSFVFIFLVYTGVFYIFYISKIIKREKGYKK